MWTICKLNIIRNGAIFTDENSFKDIILYLKLYTALTYTSLHIYLVNVKNTLLKPQ